MLARRILTNTAYNAMGRVWLILVNLLLTPLVLSYLGEQRFALWALFWTLQTWIAFGDFGIGVSVVKEVARCTEKRDSGEDINGTVFTALTFNIMITSSLLALSWWGADQIITLLHIDHKLESDAMSIALLGPLVFVILACITVFDCLLRGLQQYDKINIVAVAVSFVNGAGVWIVLHYGYGIRGLLIAVIVVYIIQLTLLILFSKHAFPVLRFHWNDISLKRLIQILPFGIHLQAGRLAELASFQADKFILVLLTPLYFVTTYDLGSKITTLIRQIPYLLTSAIFPAIAQLHADKDFHRLWLAYERGSKYLWMVSTPLCFGLCITAHLIIVLWLGHVSSEVYSAVLLLSVGYWCIVNISMATSVGTGMGWSKPVMYSSLIQSITNICLSWWLTNRLGYIGVLYATTITLTATSILLFFWFHKDFNRKFQKELRIFIKVIFANTVPALLTLLYLHLGGYDYFMEQRIHAVIPLLVCILLYGSVYLFSIKKMHLLDNTDLEWLQSYCPVWLQHHLFV